MNATYPHAYSIKRHSASIDACEAEPIRTPGCIQPHGVLFALRASDLTVLQVSENSGTLLGKEPHELLGESIATLLGPTFSSQLRELLVGGTVERNPVYAFTLSPGESRANSRALDACVHTIEGIALLELEPTSRDTGPPPDYYALVKRVPARLQATGGVAALCAAAAREVREVTGLDRVMIYRFHRDGSGEVFAEARRDDMPSWLGLRYPAEDIPRSVREIFRKLTIRPLPDARSGVVEMVPLLNPDTSAPLEMTHCALRGASVMYTEYLANMGVAATLTMPLMREGELWGLIACHHSVPHPMPHDIRAGAEFVAHLVSLELRVAEVREQAEYAKRINAVHADVMSRAAEEGGLAVMVDPAPRLLDGIRCGGAAVFHRERWWRVGATPKDSELEELGDWLREKFARDDTAELLYATDNLGAENPAARVYAAVASGLMAVPVSRNFQNLIVWFRPEQPKTVAWAGNPHETPVVSGPNGPRLTPRASFERWVEEVRGTSSPWLAVEREAALSLRVMVLELVVSRAERIAALNHDLAKSNEELDAFAYVASHDLKEPLRGIHKYASQLLEDAVAKREFDSAAQARLDSLLRLTVRMDSLLSSLLHFSRVGRLTLEMETVDIAGVVQEAVEMLGAWRHEPGVSIDVVTALPAIRCDRIRVREVFSNLIVNALKYNESANRRVEIGALEPSAYPPHWEESRTAALDARTVYFVRDNGIGIDARHLEHIFGMFKRLHVRDAYGGGSGAGLTITRKMVEQHRGIIWAESEPGKGSTFFFTLAPAAGTSVPA